MQVYLHLTEWVNWYDEDVEYVRWYDSNIMLLLELNTVIYAYGCRYASYSTFICVLIALAQQTEDSVVCFQWAMLAKESKPKQPQVV